MSQPAADKGPTIEGVGQKPKPWPWVITFIPQTSNAPDPSLKRPWEGQEPVYRVKRLLKQALRQLGLRCVEARTFDPAYTAHPVVTKPRKQPKRRSAGAAA
jgi:hypothetical protein